MEERGVYQVPGQDREERLITLEVGGRLLLLTEAEVLSLLAHDLRLVQKALLRGESGWRKKLLLTFTGASG
ncbi:MAG: hypothetical protein AB1330_03545 [Bacillota bacterium]